MQGASCGQCGCSRSAYGWAGVLLFIGGLAHAVPSLYQWFSTLTGGSPIIQIVVGILSVILAISMAAGRRGGRKVDGMAGK